MAGISDVAGILNNAVTSISAAIQTVRSIYVTGTSTTATGGAATLPANPVGFVTTTLPDGTSIKIPYYST